jgi:nitrate reductase NapE component
MQGYRTVRTSKTSYKFIKKEKEFDLFTRISNAIFPYVVGVLAGYGFLDIILRANGL